MKRKIYCTNVHLRIIGILITSVYNPVLSLLPLEGALVACTAQMSMESNCPRHSWLRRSQLIV